MSESKATPGQWEAHTAGMDAYVLCRYDGRRFLVGDLVYHPENAANARLIAAAPELLEALKVYVDHFGDPLKVARAAIAKAEGRETPVGG